MNKFLFKSTDADFQKLFQLLVTIQKNVLYSTHRIDLVVRELNKLTTDKRLQTQVDEYFEKDPFGSAFKESVDETPPQTDSENN